MSDPAFFDPRPEVEADLFSYRELPVGSDGVMALADEMSASMRGHGAEEVRLTLVSPEFPNPPYPHGVYAEGWLTAPHKLSVPSKAAPFPPGMSNMDIATPALEAMRDEALDLRWARQEIVKTIILAMVEAEGDVKAVPAGKAADHILAYLAPALAQSPTKDAPDMVLVPRVPTEAMLDALARQAQKPTGWHNVYPAMYRALLEAAPKPD